MAELVLIRFGFHKLFDCGEGLTAVHHRGAAAHHDSYADGFQQLLDACAGSQGILDVIGDTGIAAYGDGNTQGHQLFGFGGECAFRRSRLVQFSKAANGVRQFFAERS